VNLYSLIVGITLPQNVGKYLPVDTALHPRRLESNIYLLFLNFIILKKILTKFRSSTDKIFETLIGTTKLDKEKNQCIREKNESTEHSKGFFFLDILLTVHLSMIYSLFPT